MKTAAHSDFQADAQMTVRYAETDQMGIAHHANYPIWFELGRTAFFKKIGFAYSVIERNGLLLPLTDMSCHFRKPAKYEDTIEIQTSLSRLTHVRVGFYYDVIQKDTGVLLASGETQHGWTDRELNPIAVENVMPELYQKLLSCCKAADKTQRAPSR